MHQPPLSWNRDSVKEPKLRQLLKALGEDFPVVENGRGLPVAARLGGTGLRVSRRDGRAEIAGGSVNLVARGLGMLLSGLVGERGEIVERGPFKTVGLMFDCSRNAVLKVDYLKHWLRRAALMGYNQAMLYTKDTYLLPNEDGFGYLRGSYSAAEFKALDAYAARLGIEMVGCVQTLGHLEPVLRWPKYGDIKDTDAELLTTEPKSYALVDKILDFYSANLKTRRLHLGMDETHGLGRGRYLDLNGYRRPFDIYIDHLNRVVAACKKRGLEPMIWSDMFFRMGSKTMEYYDKEAVTPPDVVAKIPKEVQLVYWDYYHKDKEFYLEWIRRHRRLGHLPIMASGVWTWPLFWHSHEMTAATVRPCVEACAAEGVEEIFYTMWGDDGGFCDWSSAMAGACYAAEKSFNPKTEPDQRLLQKKFAALCDGDYAAHVRAGDTTRFAAPGSFAAAAILWDDPLLGIYRKERILENGKSFWPNLAKHYAKLAAELKGRPAGGAGNLPLIAELAAVLALKIDAAAAADRACASRRKAALVAAGKQAVKVANAIAKFETHYRAQWYERNQPHGYEVMQIRFAGQVARWQELARRLHDLANGKIKSIPEIAEKSKTRVGSRNGYRFLATASAFF